MVIITKYLNSWIRLPGALNVLRNVREGRALWEEKGKTAFDFVTRASLGAVPISLNAQIKAESARTEFEDLEPRFAINPLPPILIKQLKPADSINAAVAQYLELVKQVKEGNKTL